MAILKLVEETSPLKKSENRIEIHGRKYNILHGQMLMLPGAEQAAAVIIAAKLVYGLDGRTRQWDPRLKYGLPLPDLLMLLREKQTMLKFTQEDSVWMNEDEIKLLAKSNPDVYIKFCDRVMFPIPNDEDSGTLFYFLYIVYLV